jgi:hypothetical protein
MQIDKQSFLINTPEMNDKMVLIHPKMSINTKARA